MNDQPLAIDGGKPALEPDAFPRAVDVTLVRQAVLDVMDRGTWGDYEGDTTDACRAALAAQFAVEHVLLCCSGTIATEIALRGAGVRAGDEVILAGYDFPGNFRAIEAIGARPVLAEVVPGGWTIDPDCLPKLVNSSTTAIVVSHLHGQVADIPHIRSVLDQATAGHRIAIVEDACQVPGGQRNGTPLGALGDIATLSFGGSKLLTAGRGGAVISNDEHLIQRSRIFQQRGNDAFPLSQLQAAALIPQLTELEAKTEQRHQTAVELHRLLDEVAEIALPPLANPSTLPAYYKFPLRCTNNSAAFRDSLVAALAAEGLPVGSGFRGFTRRSARRCRRPISLQHCQAAVDSTLLLHHSVLLSNQTLLNRVAQAIKKVCCRLK